MLLTRYYAVYCSVRRKTIQIEQKKDEKEIETHKKCVPYYTVSGKKTNMFL